MSFSAPLVTHGSPVTAYLVEWWDTTVPVAPEVVELSLFGARYQLSTTILEPYPPYPPLSNTFSSLDLSTFHPTINISIPLSIPTPSLVFSNVALVFLLLQFRGL